MKIIGVDEQKTIQVIGRFSDGSDRQIIEVKQYIAQVEDAYGIIHQLTFDRKPTGNEIKTALANNVPNFSLQDMYKLLKVSQDNQNNMMAALAAIIGGAV